jgi:hypothetical protein
MPDPIDAVAARAQRAAADHQRTAEAERARRARAEEAARRVRMTGPSAIHVSDDGRHIELRTTTRMRLLFSPLGVGLLALALVLLGGSWLCIVASSSVVPDTDPDAAVVRQMMWGAAGVVAMVALIVLALWRRLGHLAPIAVHVTAQGNAGLFRRGRLRATCSPSSVTFEIIERATIWSGRDRWVGKCRISSLEGKVYGNALRVFGLTELDITRLAEFARRHGMELRRRTFGSTGGSSATYEDRSLWAS